MAKRREPHRRQPGRLDRRHVGAATLDAQHLDLVADEVARARLDRGVAAAVQHQARIAAEEPRGVEAEREIAADAGFRAMRHQGVGIAVDPRGFHRTPRAASDLA